MTSVYNLLREACGVSQVEAADHVHETRLDTVKSWSSDRRPAPDWAINQLQSLLRRIRRAGEEYAGLIKRTADSNVFVIGLPHDEQDARACGFPSVTAQEKTIAIAISLLSDDAEIRLVPRVRGTIPAPVLEEDIVIPTATDRRVFCCMNFTGDGRFYTTGNVNRRKYERLEDVGWVKGICTSMSDIEYHLTIAGRLELALLATATEAERDVPDPAPGGFQSFANDAPRRKAHPRLKRGLTCRMGEIVFTVEKIEGDVVTAKLASGAEVFLCSPAILLPTGAAS